MKISKLISIILCVALISLLFTGCKAEKSVLHSGNKKIIAVSIVPQATFVEKVCGDKFEIVTMIPSGASPETYEPTHLEMQKLEASEIYFSIGVPVEEAYILPSIEKKEKIIMLHEAAKEKYAERVDLAGRDPHIWLSPKRVITMIDKITETLCRIDAQNTLFYQENGKAYIEELEKLDLDINNLLKDKEKREFIAFHPAFGYFADDYGLSMHALEEHGKEANAKHITEMVDLAKKENIKVIFYQAESSGKQAQVFADEIGGRAVSLEPLAADYTTNLRKMALLLSEAIK